jgi:DNA-binding transcriptional LysR family regulator
LSFTIAAENLGMSRGYLSDQIKTLKKELGAPLLIRSTRSVRLTQEGERVLQSMNTVRHELLDLDRNMHHKNDAIEGPLSITAPAMFSERFLMDICYNF